MSLVAVFAIAAVTATSASALPEWGKCEAKAGGKYTNSNCTTKGKGGTFEWIKGKNLSPVKFSGESVGSGGVLTTTFLECDSGTYQEQRVPRAKCEEGGGKYKDGTVGEPIFVECEKENSSGEAVSTNQVANVNVTFKGCALLGGVPCSGKGLPEGEIKTNPLKGKLGYISKPSKEVGVLLEPAKKHGHFADFACSGEEIKVGVGVGNSKEGAYYTPENHGGYDGIISPITPVNTMTSTYEQVYTMNPGTAENIPSKFEGKHIELLEDYLEFNSEGPGGKVFSSMWTAAGEEITNVNTPEEAGEIKA